MAKPKLCDSVTQSRYGARWDQFYRDFDRHGNALPLWDVSPQLAAALDFSLIKERLTPTLPLIDVGCGTGRQTAFLAEKFPTVTGLDVSPRALEIANEEYGNPGLTFELLTDPTEHFRQLHREHGDCNVYIRGVLHQIESEELPRYCEALRSLLGATGTLYFVEVADSIRDYLKQGSGAFSRLPGPIKRTLISNFPPRGFSLAALDEIFPAEDFHLLEAGETVLNTNIQFGADEPICIPAVYGLVRSTQPLPENTQHD